MTAATTAKTGPVHAETDAATGSRWYIHPRTGERFMSVTTVLSHISKFGLPDWSARLAAEAALERLPWLNRCSRVKPCNATKTENACGQCRECALLWLANRHNDVRDGAGDRGSRVHEAAEQIALFGEGAHVDEDIRPLVDLYLKWKATYRPEYLATEMTVISRKWGYAGTLDGILRFPADSPLPKQLAHLRGVPVVDDLKTGKHLGLAEAWQVNAYARADAVLLPDGSEEPMPPIEGGLILHLRRVETPEGGFVMKAQMREVHLTDANHAAFVHELRVAESLGAGLGTGLSRPINLPKDA
jgi:hypothetical protein